MKSARGFGASVRNMMGMSTREHFSSGIDYGIEPPEDIKVLVCTANMGNAEPTFESLKEWIPFNGSIRNVMDAQNELDDDNAPAVAAKTATPSSVKQEERPASPNPTSSYDVIAIGMQEATWGNGDTKMLSQMLTKQLPSYKEVLNFQRGQMRLYVFVKSELSRLVYGVDINAENTGIGGVMWNKGGIIATLTLFRTRISFLTAHLQAHEGHDNYDRRNSSLKEILNGAKVGEGRSYKYDASVLSHYMFVMGDLNYRTVLPHDICMSTEDKEKHHEEHVRRTIEMVEEKKWDELYSCDELCMALANKECLIGFQTPPCNFNPTFKMERTEGYVYKDQRTPSYTDRILWKTAKGFEDNIETVAYHPCPRFITSDHKPIRGAFNLKPAMVYVNPRRSFKASSKNSSAMSRRDVFRRGKFGKSSVTIRLSDMKAQDLPAMDPNGKADPYVLLILNPKELYEKPRATARGFFKKVWPRSKTINFNRNPDWGEEALELVMDKKTPEELYGAMLLITVIDFDLASEDDLIGTIQINLAELLGPVVKKHSFHLKETLVKNGKERGTFECTLSISM